MKNKLFLLFLKLCLSVFSTLLAQPSTSGKWAVGINFTPEFGYRTLSTNNSESANRFRDIKNDREIPKLGYTTGIQACYNFYKSFSMNLGIQFVNRVYGTKQLEIANPADPIFYHEEGSKPYITFNHQYVQFPLLLNYSVSYKNWLCQVGAGIVPGTFIKTESRLIVGDKMTASNTTKTDPYNSLSLGAAAKLNLAYKLGNHWRLSLSPIGYYSIAPTLVGAILEHLYSYGMEVGVNYKF